MSVVLEDEDLKTVLMALAAATEEKKRDHLFFFTRSIPFSLKRAAKALEQSKRCEALFNKLKEMTHE